MSKSLHQTLLWNMLFVTVAGLLLVGGIWFGTSYSEFNARMDRASSRNEEWRRSLLETITQQVVDYRARTREEVEKRVREGLRERVIAANAVLEVIVKEQNGERSTDAVLKTFSDTMRQVRFDNGRGYYFGLRLDGREMLFATPSEFEGQSFFEKAPPQGPELLENLAELAREEGGGFMRYRWTKPGAEGDQHEKISYVMLCEAAGCVVGTGEYIDEINASVDRETMEWVQGQSFRNSGCVFLLSASGDILIDSGPQDSSHHQGESWNRFVDSIMTNDSDENFVRMHPEIEDKGHPDQVGFYRRVPGVDYYVIALMDDEGVAERTAAMASSIEGEILNRVVLIVAVLLIVGILAFAVVGRISHSLQYAFAEFTGFFSRAAVRDEPLERSKMPFKEFEKLAQSANDMIKRRREAAATLAESESQVKELEALLLAAVEQSPAGIIVTDGKSGKGRMANEEAVSLFGNIVEGGRELVPLRFEDELAWQAFSPNGQAYDPDQMPLTRAVREGEVVRNEELVIRYEDGSSRCLLVNASPVRDESGEMAAGIAVFLDITDLKRTEYERSRLVAAVDQSSEAVLLTDRDMRIEYANQAFHLFGLDESDEYEGRSLWFLAERLSDGSLLHVLEDATGRGLSWGGVLKLKNAKDNELDIEASLTPLRDGENLLSGYTVVLRDITDDLRMQALLRQSQKMEAIGTLAGGIAHDFNNMLQAICGFANLVLSELPKDHEEYRHVEQIALAGARATELVAQILTFSRQNEEEQKPINTAVVVKEVVKLLEGSLPSTIEVISEVKSHQKVLSSPSQMHQVVMNLTTNAYHAMRAKGKGILRIELEDIFLDETAAQQLVEVEAGKYVLLTVRDTGCGMDDETRERIFDPFFTTREAGEGTGLGLSTVHGIVRRSGGTISVESQVGEGTSIHVYLPAIGIEDYARERMDTMEDLPGGSERVMVIDDEDTVGMLAASILKGLGYEVVVFERSLEALSVYKSDPSAFDAVLTDMTMPGLTGADLARALLAIRPDLPIVLSTGYSESINEESALQLGVKRFVRKPFTARDIAFSMREALDSETKEAKQPTAES